MKKLLINVTNGFSLRYLCHSDILQTIIKNKKIKVFILSNSSESTKKNLALDTDNVEYIEYNEENLKKFHTSSKFYNFIELIRLYVHGGNFKTPSVMFEYLKIEKKKKFIFKLFIFFFRKFKFLRKMIVIFQSKYFPKELFQTIKKINPDLILTSSLGVFNFDEYVLRSAKALKIKTCTSILSWDNSTTRGYPGALSDYVFAWTKIMKEELISFSDISPHKIIESGVPHFDNYFKENGTEIFDVYKKFNIIQNKKIIFFVTKGPSTFQYNPNIADLICKNILNKKIQNAHVITRIHPLFYKVDNNKLEFQNAIDVFKLMEKKYNCLSIDMPNITSLKQNFEMDKNEQDYLKNLIMSSDLIINIFSTLNIEGSIFNKPLINIDFDNFKPMYEWNKKFERQSLAIDRSLDHNKRILSYGGISNIKNENDLIEKINYYFDNPNFLEEKRKIIKENEVGLNCGNSGNFIANKILEFL